MLKVRVCVSSHVNSYHTVVHSHFISLTGELGDLLEDNEGVTVQCSGSDHYIPACHLPSGGATGCGHGKRAPFPDHQPLETLCLCHRRGDWVLLLSQVYHYDNSLCL